MDRARRAHPTYRRSFWASTGLMMMGPPWIIHTSVGMYGRIGTPSGSICLPAVHKRSRAEGRTYYYYMHHLQR